MKKTILFITLVLLVVSCGSIKSSIKNVDDSAPVPVVKNNAFVITSYSKDKKYGYDKDYPVNVFYKNVKDEDINPKRFLDALTGPKGETITYKKVESCCPFPTKRGDSGAGFLDIYEINYSGLKKPIKLYFNIYSKGYLFIPKGFELKK